MKVEYLVMIDSNEEYCKSINTLNYLIQSYDGITISNGKISYEGAEFAYDVQLGESDNTSHRFFHIRIDNEDESNIGMFQSFLKLIRTILTKISGFPVEILCDDLSSSFCFKAYPIIHNLENQMRKLITKFMLTNVGLGWTKDNTPEEVTASIKNTKAPLNNFLYEVDFIQLSKFLFTDYAGLDSKKIIEKIKGAESVSDLDLAELREFVPQSNWERYFAEIVDCTGEFLEKRWGRLYELRNKVAHNRFIGESEYIDLEKLNGEVSDKLQLAIESLDKIHITDEQKEEVAENVAFNRDEVYGEFLEVWNILLEQLYDVASYVSDESDKGKLGSGKNWRGMANILISKDVINKDFKNELQDLAAFRNTLVHHTDVIFTKESIISRMKALINLYDQLREYEKTIQQEI
ncbi:hypothetical protein KDW99_10850 [Marinomonas rhizomae]|uniref:HEPN domain-containing protein n=1 Tax=Marinomonas rhizomae TaxID=491948 RepID=UPI0021050707|nr:HEPN domain-containing protein [Marinomonas rhizomae]UTV97802.1 hypothetical protein KDW99_10850 [Marinomonas rhizomae]